ncbi:MAG TPA: class II fructose-bisphosphate aldolase [Terriglobales bacterium]
MPDLREVLKRAQSHGVAVGHFNSSDFVMLKAVFASARELKFLGVGQSATLVRELREQFDFPTFLNADHTHSLSGAIEADKAGFNSIVFDLSALPFEDNIRETKSAIGVLKNINPVLLIEGEIGDIGTGSEIHDSAPDLSKGLTTPEQAKQYVDETGVDILAPAVGNMHGMIASMVAGKTKKRLDIARIAQIKSATNVLITLHGASGTEDDDLRKAMAAGINVVHINTELRVAWRRGLEEGLAKEPNEVVPYKILPSAFEAIKQVATSRLRLFNKLA